jgi:DNA-binding NtrC family response regulator
LVDDETDILDFLERVLRRKYRVARGGSVAEARTHLEKEHFDAVLTDQMMPAETGLQLLAHVRERFPKTRRVLISGYTAIDEMNDAIQEGLLHEHVLKPVDSRSVLDAVERALLSGQ